jgi:hypothetical protein
MSIQKNFIIRNGLEVDTNLIVADATTNKVGIGTTIPYHTLHVNGGIGVTSLKVTGISTFNNLVIDGYVNVGGTTGKNGQVLVSTGNSTSWKSISKSSTTLIADPGQDTFIFEYELGTVEVYINGVRLTSNEFTATDGSTIVLNDACFGGETIEIVVSQSIVLVNPGVSTSGGESYWVSTNAGIHTLSNVGIGTTNPTEELTVFGDGSFTGVVTATSFSGDGSQLTGIIASGSSIIITDDGVLVGTAASIDFGSNLSVSPVSAGLVTVTASSGTLSQWVTTSAGIHTFSNVGIGTTNPTEELTVFGDARVTGILTVGTASITLDGTTNIINVGSGVTIDGSTGTIEASAIVIEGITITGAAVTSITAGSGISVDQSTGNVTISATGGEESYWASTAAGIHTTSNVGIGTTQPVAKLHVNGAIALSASPIFMARNTVDESVVIPSGYNAMSIGPILTVGTGVTVTVVSGANWFILGE